MQIICTGATGLVGSNFVTEALRRGHKVVALCDKTEFPPTQGVEVIHMGLTDLQKVERLVIDRFPEAIVNCAAISSPSVVDVKPELAHKLNVLLPEKLAQLANHVSARFIHLSTDTVFDGTKAPYLNTDVPCPLNLYGQTKLLAEEAVLKYAAPLSVVLRISHVCGRGLSQNRSFDEKLFQAWARGEKVALPDNEIKKFQPVSRVAELLVELVERQNISGIYHYCGIDSLSRYDAALAICKFFRLDPDKLIEAMSLERRVDLSLDMSNLADKVKTPSVPFSEILLEIQVPDACKDWYEKTSGLKVVKRFKL